MEEGNYGSTLAILKTIAAILEQEYSSNEEEDGTERNRGRNRGGGGGGRNRARGYINTEFLNKKHIVEALEE